MTRYSQQNEQDFILEFFAKEKAGFFIDIGAGDGFNGSNVRALWEKGWMGMFIEPNKIAFKQLLEVYGSGERAILVHAAICTANGPVKFYEHPTSGWSSLEPCLGDPKDYHAHTVLGLRLESLNIPWKIDFLSIDAEGKDLEILETLPDNMRPTLIMAECDKPNAAKSLDVRIGKKGYTKVWTNGANSAYRYAASG
jgi:FkbM family methyltransferase